MLELAGVVEPAEQVVLRTPVSGKIVSVNEQFIEGGLIPKADMILQTDPSNYELGVKYQKPPMQPHNLNMNLN